VNPETGANTQRIESHWGHVKTKIMRMMRGTTKQLLQGHLAEYWWKGLHEETAFEDILLAIRGQFPLR